MVARLSPLATIRQVALPAILALAGALGCVDHNPGGTTLFVFDGSSSSVKVWDDVNKVHDAFSKATAAPDPDRTIQFTSVVSPLTLGWGGLAVDNSRNRLYLVSQGGTVYAIAKADTQNGNLSSTNDITSFSLASASDHYGSGAFGQAAVDVANNTLYVQETSLDGQQARVWYVANVSNWPNQVPTPVATLAVASDQWGAGLAAQSGKVYALFGSGSSIYDSFGNPISGPRLRMGQNNAFAAGSNVLIGSATGIPGPVNYGSLGFDNQHSLLFVWAQNSSPAAVLMFNQSQFSLNGLNQAPFKTLGDAAGTLANLRIISHPANSDWLLGADMATPALTGAGTGTLHIWKSPSGGGVAAVSGPLAAAPEIRGLAVGGTN